MKDFNTTFTSWKIQRSMLRYQYVFLPLLAFLTKQLYFTHKKASKCPIMSKLTLLLLWIYFVVAGYYYFFISTIRSQHGESFGVLTTSFNTEYFIDISFTSSQKALNSSIIGAKPSHIFVLEMIPQQNPGYNTIICFNSYSAEISKNSN